MDNDKNGVTPRHRPQRLLMQWHVTDRCNLRCTHCYQENFRDTGNGMASWLPVLDQFRTFLAEGSPRVRGPIRGPIRGQITVTGGEPFAHPEFFDLLERLAAHRDEFSFAILSNGTLIDAALARRLAGLGPRFVQLSVDGNPATHDALRGTGNHQRVVAAARALVAAGVRTLLAFTAHHDNFREFPEVARLGRRLKVARVWADRLIPHGQGGALRALSRDETREFIGILRQAKTENEGRAFGRRTEIALHRALQFLAGGPAYRCTAGDTLLTVMPDGTLYPCRRLPLSAGNLHVTPLSQLYDGPLLRRLRDPAGVADGCRQCVYERLCGGGLRCLAFAQTGQWTAADPGCWLVAD